MRDGNHNLKINLKGFEYKHEKKSKSGSKLTVRDENGKILHEGEFKSFTANFMKLLYGNMIGSGTVTATDLSGVSANIDEIPNAKMNFAAGSGIQKFGISVGSDSTAVSSSDNDLTWVSDLTYNNVIVDTPAIDGTTVKVDITREISNVSGASKTLYEAGLICGSEGEYDENILIVRDLSAVTLLNNQKATWTYSIAVDFDNTTGGFVKNFLDSFIIDWNEILADDSTPPSTQFSARHYHTSLVFDSKMWVIGGYTGSARLNDVWYSSDGVTWTQATSSTDFSARQQHTSLVFDSKMWVIGGADTTRLNDVWSWGRQLQSEALITDDTLGIIVGTSDTAFSSTDTDLNTKISHGTGAGEMKYGVFPHATFTTEPAISGSKTTMTLSRSFENNSGASITIREVGIMSVNGLLCRIIPATPIVVENGATEVISIEFETEV